jgi:drug/metabolite transporter (DMT)-like permease
MFLSWQVLVGISVVSYSVAILFQRLVLKNTTKPIAYSIFSQLLCAAMLGAYGLFTNQFKPFELAPAFWSLGFMTLLYAFASVVTSFALQLTEASKFTVLFASRGLVAILVAAIFLGEQLGAQQLVGAVLVFIGVACASWEVKRLSLQRGDYLALIGAVLFGFANVNDRFLLQNLPILSYLFLAFLLPPLLLAVWYPSELKNSREFLRQPALNRSLLLCAMYSISGAAFFGALQVADNTAQVVTTNLVSVILIVALSAVFLQERKHLWQKMVGAVLAFAGLLFLN